MLYWSAIFFVIALVAALLGFGGLAHGAADIGKVLFFLFIILFVVFLGLAWLGSKMINQLWLNLTPDLFDTIFAGLAGVVLAVIIGQSITAGLYAYHSGVAPDYLEHSQLAHGLLKLPSFRMVLNPLLHPG